MYWFFPFWAVRRDSALIVILHFVTNDSATLDTWVRRQNTFGGIHLLILKSEHFPEFLYYLYSLFLLFFRFTLAYLNVCLEFRYNLPLWFMLNVEDWYCEFSALWLYYKRFSVTMLELRVEELGTFPYILNFNHLIILNFMY